MWKLAFVVSAVTMVAQNVLSSEMILWQIGKRDNSYKEFALSNDFSAYLATFPDDVTFHASEDDPGRSWSSIHPGPADGWAGAKSHRFTIIFTLQEEPIGVYPLIIDLVDTHGSSPPVLEISVNKESGTAELPKGTGDESFKDPAAGKEHVIRLDLPARVLRKGENRIILTNKAGAWLLYDSIVLAHDPDSKPSVGVTKLTVSPTIRYAATHPNKQIIEIQAEFMPGTPPCHAHIRVGDYNMKITLKPPLFGMIRKEVSIPAVNAPTPAQVSIGDIKTEWVQKPERCWLLFIQPSSHVDIGYTDLQERVIRLHNHNISLAVELCQRYPNFVWNTEAAWVEDNYLSLMPADKKQKFLAFAQQGRIGCQAIYGNMLTGICSHESLIRALYYAYSVAREHRIPFDIAMSSDVPTQVGTLPMVLAGAGIRYFSAGLNLTRANSFNILFDKSPFYWRGPDGSKVLTWFADAYAKATTTGLTADLDRAKEGIEAFLRRYDREDYPYDAVLGFGGYWDNQPLKEDLAKTVAEWNKRYAYPKIILCRGPEFFEYIEANFKDKIPTYSGDGGAYWEDGAGSSARETALVRQSKENLISAEKLYSLCGEEYPKAEFRGAWKSAILYDEHTWGAHCSISEPKSQQTVRQWVYKAQFAYKVARESKTLLQKGLKAFAARIKAPRDSILVFNPLDVPASGLVRVTDNRSKVLELWASDIPGIGYKLFPLSDVKSEVKCLPSAHDTSEPERQNLSDKVRFENAFYRLEVDCVRGVVTSLYDKELSRELVDRKSSHGLNGYIYASGYGREMRIHGTAGKCIVTSQRLPYRTVVQITTSAYMTPEIVSEIILWDLIKRVDFNNTIRKKGTYAKEAGYFVFPFAFENPQFRIEVPNGIIQPDKDMLPGACMQWYCTQDYVSISDDNCTVVWTSIDTPLITLCDVNHETFSSPLPIANGHLYAYVFNNYWYTNYKASQSGQFTFRFSLTSRRDYDHVAASQFGRSVRNPLLAYPITGENSTQHTSPMSATLLSVNPRNVVVQAVKAAEFERGLIIRLREVSGKETVASLTLPPGVRKIWRCNLVEETMSKLDIKNRRCQVQIGPYGLATLLLQ